ncbi:hypothetical protein Pmar_PMAR012337 [Perkinsus marinus ATCC 50983]|uniref:Uncharacterized protein n=1 Tax=Perkinsus marinus (strain ATCC 50983 / TXsc) TaxID=423536 RepID=C5K726_PERM5|nr:hypothetical protein Pmar_PMAR012337 [Perkinsus marinus ATCC 50983]EER19361.1 hypothetical protein Pmar_PMAR012337 [Perkinsus marinus ATCC 50983]|eukprot:XP_002787565.1 hypothetical protein Pmar_PMAR012337 [Perkinsus marinus ATCC 50983]
MDNTYYKRNTFYNRLIQQKLDKSPRRAPPSPPREQAHPQLRHPTTKQIENYKKAGVLGDVVGTTKRLEIR